MYSLAEDIQQNYSWLVTIYNFFADVGITYIAWVIVKKVISFVY